MIYDKNLIIRNHQNLVNPSNYSINKLINLLIKKLDIQYNSNEKLVILIKRNKRRSDCKW